MVSPAFQWDSSNQKTTCRLLVGRVKTMSFTGSDHLCMYMTCLYSYFCIYSWTYVHTLTSPTGWPDFWSINPDCNAEHRNHYSECKGGSSLTVLLTVPFLKSMVKRNTQLMFMYRRLRTTYTIGRILNLVLLDLTSSFLEDIQFSTHYDSGWVRVLVFLIWKNPPPPSARHCQKIQTFDNEEGQG